MNLCDKCRKRTRACLECNPICEEHCYMVFDCLSMQNLKTGRGSSFPSPSHNKAKKEVKDNGKFKRRVKGI